jgi:bifunctional non-homologous end joining protein LigD
MLCFCHAGPYRPGRRSAWVKVRRRNREEFVVPGWKLPRGHLRGIGSLHVDYDSPSGDRHRAGMVGTRFNTRELSLVRALLDPIPRRDNSAFCVRSIRSIARSLGSDRDLLPKLNMHGWPGSARLGRAMFLGIREDNRAAYVVAEIADPRAARISVRSPPGGVSRNG